MTKPLTYHTLEGIEVPYGPVSSRLIGLIDTQYPTDIDPPTYKFVDVTGEIQELPHDATSIESENTTDEEKKAWDDYLAEKDRLIKKHNEELIRLCFLKGIKLSLPEDESWLEDHRYLKVPIPENPQDLKLLWLFTEVVKVEHDIYQLTRAILGAANAYLGMRAVAASTFPGSVGQRNGTDASEPDEATADNEQGVVA